MNGTITRTTIAGLRQRSTSIMALAAFILAMLLGGGAPHGVHSKPQPPVHPAAQSAMP